MNRQFQTISGLLKHIWAIEPVWAEQHLPLINAYFSGNYPTKKAFDDDDDDEGEEEKPFAYCVNPHASGTAGTDQTRYDLADPNLPEGSILVLDLEGAMMKNGFCGGPGTLDYARIINQAYEHPSIIGGIGLVDTPGGQLSGTPSLHDAVRNPAKPFGVVVNEGMMCSAGVWGFCGADFIYATQKTDQIGSIGVYVRMVDWSKYYQEMGMTEHSIYSDLSPEKNLPYREALAGKYGLMKADLNESADLFHQAVMDTRGDKLKLSKTKAELEEFGPFVGSKGAVYYASKAQEIGLIDGFGNLDTAITKIQELSSARKTSPAGSRPAKAATEFQLTEASAPIQSDTNPNSTDMFGDKHKALSALKGREASSITAEELNAINASLDEQGITGARVISSNFLQEAEEATSQVATLQTQLTAAKTTISDQITQIKNLTESRDEYKGKAEKFGSQPGATPSASQKTEEASTVGEETDTYISETDAEMNRQLAKQKTA